MRGNHLGGENARDWRRRIASLSESQKEDVRTLKFQLDVPGRHIDIKAAEDLYDTAEGVDKGSLIGLLCAVHLSGFRLFSKGDETKTFRNADRYPDSEFAEVFAGHYGFGNFKIVPSKFEEFLGTQPRTDRTWDEETLSRRLYRVWTGKNPERNPDEALLDLSERISRVLLDTYSSWAEVAQDRDAGRAAISREFQEINKDFPDFSVLTPEAPLEPDNATIAWDPNADFTDLSACQPGLWLHEIVARLGQRVISEEGVSPDSTNFSKRVQEHCLSSQLNGLSWLYGKGLAFLTDSTLDEVREAFNVPDSKGKSVAQVVEFAKAIPQNRLFKQRGRNINAFSDFRGSVGGKIGSWIANYLNRLVQLRSLMESPPSIDFPEDLCAEENSSIFSGSTLKPEEIRELLKALPARIKRARAALSQMTGESAFCRDSIADVEQVSREIHDLISEVNSLNNRIDQESEKAALENGSNGTRLSSLKVVLPKGLGVPPRVNRISGGSVRVREVISEIETTLDTLIQGRRSHFSRLSLAYGGQAQILNPLPYLSAQEQKKLNDKKKLNNRRQEHVTGDEQAKRLLLNLFARLAYRLSEDTSTQIRDLVKPLFQKQKEANRFFYNQQGSIYRIPYSNSRHTHYSLHEGALANFDCLGAAEALVAEIENTLRSGGADVPLAELLRDMLSLQTFIFFNRLQALPAQIASSELRPGGDISELLSIPDTLLILMEEDEVSRDVALRVLNQYNSAINGCLFAVTRKEFITRVRFQRDNTKRLLYVPKAKNWNPPLRYSSSKSSIADGLAASWIEKDANGFVDPVASITNLQPEDLQGASTRAVLRQCPHSWYFSLDLLSGGGTYNGVQIDTSNKRLRCAHNLTGAVRLQGPPSFSSRLSRLLTDDKLKFGDPTLIFDQFYEQDLT